MDAMTPPEMLQGAQPPMQAQMAQALVKQPKPVTHDVTIVTTRKLAQAKVLGVPPEEFGIERGARDIPTCNYCFHDVITKTEAQLIAEGFDKEQVKALVSYSGNTEVETITRDSVQEHSNAEDTANSAARLVRITEHYVRMDYEGNGKPCLYQVITGGDQGQILKRDGKPSITAFDAIPFAATTPVPITHRFFGRSIADLVMDIQRIKTALLRSALDSKYLAAGADIELPEAACGPSTINDLLGPKRPGRVIRTKQGGQLKYQVVPDTSESAFAAMSYMDSLIETRTGVTKQGQGIDADALQNQSATAVAQVFSASQMRTKLIARIIAEGVKDLFALLHGTIRKHGQQAQTVRLRNTWVNVDPRDWKNRNDMTINVGLGSGGRAQQFAQQMALLNIQKEIIAGGKGNLVGDKEIFNSVSDIAKIMGHKNPDKYINDPSATDPQTGQPLHPPLPPPPDPKVMQIQAQAANDQAELRMKAQLDQQKAKDAAALAQFKAETDAKLKVLEAHIKAIETERKMAHDQQAHKAKIVETVVGLAATAHEHDMAMAHEQQTHDASIAQGEASHQAKLEQMKQKPKGPAK